ncbi:MAG: hypothetical protein M3Y39_18200 [Chloroflexota bacterium]|nr:hypothetical protein [Chloroflexota bacterium]
MCKSDSYGRRVLYESLRLCFCSIALLPCLLGISALGGFGQVSFAKSLTSPVYTINGTVFDDYNQNGTQDAREPGDWRIGAPPTISLQPLTPNRW